MLVRLLFSLTVVVACFLLISRLIVDDLMCYIGLAISMLILVFSFANLMRLHSEGAVGLLLFSELLDNNIVLVDMSDHTVRHRTVYTV